MMPEQQQRILGYFIEEAKDHLNTIEQGLLNLQSTIQDPEMVSEVFRAAHSVKGGAAMLSLGSIQRTAHRLEDYFKVLKETPTTQVDRDLESMFLQVFDGLQALLEELQGPFGLTEDKAEEVMTDIEPVFEQLEGHLNTLVANAPAVAEPAPVAAAERPPSVQQSATRRGEDSALKLVFSSDVPGHLREMLTLFKQADNAASRQALQGCCEALERIGEQFDLAQWCTLTAVTRQAVGNPDQTYRALAPVVIKELKRAQEQVLSGNAGAIAISSELEALKPIVLDADEELGDIDSLLEDALSTTDEPDLADLFDTDREDTEVTDTDDLSWLDGDSTADEIADSAAATEDIDLGLDALDAVTNNVVEKPVEPTVGSAELNSLADLFEGEVTGLESPWEEMSEGEAIAEPSSPDIELPDDFSDLLDQSLEANTDNGETDDDLVDLFGETASIETVDDSLVNVDLEADGVSDETASDDFADLFDDAGSADSSLEDGTSADTDLDDLLDAAEDDAADLDAMFEEASVADETSDLDDDLLGLGAASSADMTESADDRDLDLGDDALDPNVETAALEDNGDDDFGALFDGSEADALDAAETSEGDLDLDADALFDGDRDGDTILEGFSAATGDAEATDHDADDFDAIDDPWSSTNADAPSDDGESALDALDGLWDESYPKGGDDNQPEASAATINTDDELDLSGFADLAVETDADSSEMDLNALMEGDAIANPADDFDALFDEATDADSQDADFADLLEAPNPETQDAEATDAVALDLDDLTMPDAAPKAPETALEDSAGDTDLDLDDILTDAAPESDVDDFDLDLDLASTAGETDALDLDDLDIDAESQSLASDSEAEMDLGAFDEGSADDDDTVSSDALNLNGAFDEAIATAAAAEAVTAASQEGSLFDELTASVTNAAPTAATADDDFFSTESAATDATPEDESFDLTDELLTDDVGSAAAETTAASNDDIDDFFDSSAVEASPSDSDTDADGLDFLEQSMAADDDSADADPLFGEDASAGLSDADDAEMNLDLANFDAAPDTAMDELSNLEPEASDTAEAAEANLEGNNLFGSADTDELGLDIGDASADSSDLDLDLAEEPADVEAIAFPELDDAGHDEEPEADLADLDALMDDASSEADVTATEDAGDFDDLDSLVSDADTEPAPSLSKEDGIATTDFIEGEDAEDFDDLDSLLSDDAMPEMAVESPATPDMGNVDFDELDSLLGDESQALPTPQNGVAADGGGDEFGDLEKLLEEADQTLGGGSPAMRAATTSKRSGRRVGGIVDQTMRVSVKHLDNLNNLVGELVVNRNSLEQDQDRLRQFLDNLLFQIQQLNDVGQRMRDLYERSLLESSLLASRQAFQSGGSLTRTSESPESNGGGHATGATFDALEMDRFTGFHTLTQEMVELIVRVRESSSDIAYTVESTDQIARQFRQVTTQLQEGLNKARMVPFAQTADRLPRAVRDISIKCDKEARLVVEGRDTLIDKMILERLYDPMTHLVNNAITHGIESPDERVAAGKPREGTITVRAFYQGNQTVIYIADDGAGINPDVVQQKAIQKGLITQAEANSMNTLDTYELLFHHGFSTRDKADDFAGRGVGMDVVRTALSEIRGSITIDSELGKGTSFTIRLPLTLSISKALSCLNNQAQIAFPMDGVEDMFDVPRDRIQTDAEGHTSILWRDMTLAFQPLSELLHFNRALGRGRVYGGSQDEDMISIVVLRNANTYIGIQVDRVLGEQEIVIKQIEGPVPKPMGIAGATVLGDGRVMPIGDVLELIDIAQGRVRREVGSSLWSQVDLPPEEEAPAVKSDPTVLIVDDSITVRELLSMSFNKVGYRVEQARDGQEAWEKMRSGLPCDIVFCDIEMPRMDGLELLSRMQKDSALNQIPIAMLTSRGADRHRQMAVDLGASGYFTKPYLEEALLDAAQRMLNGEVLLTAAAEPEAE